MKRYKYKTYKQVQPVTVIFVKALVLFLMLHGISNVLRIEYGKLCSILVAFIYFVTTSVVHTCRKRVLRQEYLLYRGSNMDKVDKLDGFEFERYLRAHFKRKGYKVELTPPKQDFGVDLILIRGSDRIAVQAKRYNHEMGYKVNYRAVQEVAAGKAYYNCNKGIVVTNSFFTTSARQLAEVNDIDLWDRKRMIMEFQARNAPPISEYKQEFCWQGGN